MNDEIKNEANKALEQFQFFEQEVLSEDEKRIFRIAFKFGFEKAAKI